MVVNTPTSLPPCWKASGIIVSASIVNTAPPAKASTNATVLADASSSSAKPARDERPATTVTSTQSQRILDRIHPALDRPVVAATASGRFDRKTAASTATLTPSPVRRLSPITIDSGMPSSTIPSTIARGEPSACSPPERLR
jgi:hypothetical protein